MVKYKEGATKLRIRNGDEQIHLIFLLAGVLAAPFDAHFVL